MLLVRSVGIDPMKNYVIAALVVLVVLLAVGFAPIERATNEVLRHGSLTGVENCIEYSKSDLLSGDAVKAACVRAFEKPLYSSESATGRAGPSFFQGIVRWTGNLENKTSDHVTTWVAISVSVYGEDGSEREFSADTSIWIDPLRSADFSVTLRALELSILDDIEFCELTDDEPKSCMSWGVTDVRGLEV